MGPRYAALHGAGDLPTARELAGQAAGDAAGGHASHDDGEEPRHAVCDRAAVPGRSYSVNTSSRLRFTAGSTRITSSATDIASSSALIGRSTNTIGLPRDRYIARRKFSSISGPRMNPRMNGAGSAPTLTKNTPSRPNSSITQTSNAVLAAE